MNLFGRLLLIFSVTFCTSYEHKDQTGRTIRDYTSAIRTSPSDHESYYKRAALWHRSCRSDKLELLRHCLDDSEKAILLAGENNAKFEYFQQRGYCRAGIELRECDWDTHRSNYMITQSNSLEPSNPRINQSIADMTRAIALTKAPDRLATLYDRRAHLLFYLKRYREVLADIAQLWQIAGSSSWNHANTDPRYQAEVNNQVSILEKMACEQLVKESEAEKSPELQKWKDYLVVVNEKYYRNSNAYWADPERRARLDAQTRERQVKEAQEARLRAKRQSSVSAIPENHRECDECHGSGTGKYYEMGDSAHCLADRQTGKIKQCNAAREGAFVTKKCHVCGGKGYVLNK